MIWSSMLFLFSFSILTSQARAPWLYVNSFKSGKLVVFDVGTAQIVRCIPVDDGLGIIGLAVTSDGGKIFVVDGSRSHRLRVLEAATGNQLVEQAFEDRALQLGGRPVIHLTADDRWLFLQTYDYGAAASGVRIFDVQAGRFVSLGLRSRQCGTPNLVSAKDGTLIAICPKLVHELRALPKVPGEFLPGPEVTTPLQEWADAALTPDGKNLYVLGYVKEGAPWLLIHWKKGDKTVLVHDLRQILEVAADAPGRGGEAWLDVSADGKMLGLVHGPRIWILERKTLSVLHRGDLSWPADKVAFTPDGQNLLTFTRVVEKTRTPEGVLLRISVASGELHRVRLGGLEPPMDPAIFTVAPAP